MYIGDSIRDWQPYDGCHCGHHQTLTTGTGTNTTFTGFPVAEFSDGGYVGQHRA